MKSKAKFLNIKNVITLILILLIVSSVSSQIVLLAPITTNDSLTFSKDTIKWDENTIYFNFIKRNKDINFYLIKFDESFKIEKLSYRIKYFFNLITETEVDVVLNNNNIKIPASLWFRVLNNNDLMLFIRFKNKNNSPINLNYSITSVNESIVGNDSMVLYRFQYNNKNYKDDGSKYSIKKLDSNKTAGDTIYLKVQKLYKTKMTVFKGALFQYSLKGNGLIERFDSDSEIEINNNSDSISINNKTILNNNKILDDWYILSENSLLNIDSELTKKYLINTDFSMKKRYFENGFYYITTNNAGLKGENEKTYYWDYSTYTGRSLLEFYFTGHETFIYDIAINSFYSLHKQKNKFGYWSSNTLSLWLKEEYGINEEYFDTRFSVDAGLFLNQIYLRFNNKEALSMSRKIADLLVKFIKDGNGIATSNYGFLIYDYIVPDKKIKTHMSLNHLLNESFFLLNLYDITGEEIYKNASIRIIKGISFYDTRWIDKSNGDLWYCLLPYNVFGIKDYETLTYNDLLRFRKLSKKVLGTEFEIIEKLGQSKESFLYNKGIVLVKKFLGKEEKIYAKRETAQ